MVLQGRVFKLPWILLLFSVTSADESSTTRSSNFTEPSSTVVCAKDIYDADLDIRQVLGKWGVVELYMHLRNEGVNMYRSCPQITLWISDEIPRSTFGPSTETQLFHVQHIKAKFRQEYRYLRLLWDEGGHTIEYSLYFRNDSAGYWQAFDGQNGTITTRPSYQQFSGTVQVLKAVHDHLVLSFCQEESNGSPAQLYSVLFSREPGVLARWEIDAVHAMLQTKKLSVASRRMVCGNDAVRPIYSIVFSIITCVVAYFISS